MKESSGQVNFLNPQGTVETSRKKLSPRIKDLRGKVAGLLVIPMSSSGDFIDRIEELLVEKYGVSKVIKKWKSNATKASLPEFINEIASSTDFVIGGVGT